VYTTTRHGVCVNVIQEDILNRPCDVLVTTANPGFQLTGGIGAQLMARLGFSYQGEVNKMAQLEFGSSPAPPGSILVTGAFGMACDHIIHAVGIDVFYKTHQDVLAGLTRRVIESSVKLGARHLAMPAFATGYGRYPMDEAARAMASGLEVLHEGAGDLTVIDICLKSKHRYDAYVKAFQASSIAGQ